MKKGFTLIELLAVIVILAIIALIATPVILNIINDTKENSIKISAQNYINSVNINRFKNSEVISGSYTVSELKSLGVDGEGYPSDGILFLGPKSISGCIDIDNKKIFYYQ